LADDTLEPHATGVLEDDRAVAAEVFVETNSVARSAQEFGEL